MHPPNYKFGVLVKVFSIKPRLYCFVGALWPQSEAISLGTRLSLSLSVANVINQCAILLKHGHTRSTSTNAEVIAY